MKCLVHRVHTIHELNSSLSTPQIFKNETVIYKAVRGVSHELLLLDSIAMNCWDLKAFLGTYIFYCLSFRQLLLWLNLPCLNLKSMHIQWTRHYMYSATATFLIKMCVSEGCHQQVAPWQYKDAVLWTEALISTVSEITNHSTSVFKFPPIWKVR